MTRFTTDKFSQYFSFGIGCLATGEAQEAFAYGTLNIPRTPDLFRASGGRQTVLEMDRIEWMYRAFPRLRDDIVEPLEDGPRMLEIKWGLFYRPIQSFGDMEANMHYASPACFWLNQHLFKYDPEKILIHGEPAVAYELLRPENAVPLVVQPSECTDIWQDNRGFGRLWPLERMFWACEYSNHDGDVGKGFEPNTEMLIYARIWYRFATIDLKEWLGMTTQMTLGAGL